MGRLGESTDAVRAMKKERMDQAAYGAKGAVFFLKILHP